MSNEKDPIEAALQDELTHRQVVDLLSTDHVEILGELASGPEGSAMASIMLHGLHRQLSELGIVSIQPWSVRRQKAFESGEWDTVHLLDGLMKELPLKDNVDITWTPLGREVAEVCKSMVPPPTYNRQRDPERAAEANAELDDVLRRYGLDVD